MSNYRIVQYPTGYHLQVDQGCMKGGLHLLPRWVDNWIDISIFKTLKQARKEKERLEIQEGRIIE